ncbi:hypothetical protein ACFE04_010030 [Oxalis oulophora]
MANQREISHTVSVDNNMVSSLLLLDLVAFRRNLSHTSSESAADRKTGETSDDRQASRGISAAVIAADGAAVLLSPSISSNDVRGVANNQLEILRRTIADPTVSVPSRSVHESALIGASAVNPLDILVIGGGATSSGVGILKQTDYKRGIKKDGKETKRGRLDRRKKKEKEGEGDE